MRADATVEPTTSDARGQSSTLGVLLMVAAVFVVAGTTFVYFDDVSRNVHEPAMVTLETETRAVDFGGSSECSGPEELVVDVTITSFQQADEIYVIVHDEGAESKKTVWADPSSADVGETKTLANELTGGEVDVDIGGGNDYAYCPGDSATFTFYARYDGETLSLHRVDL